MGASPPAELLLLLFAWAAIVQGRQLTATVCPIGCEANKCVPDKTSGHYKCTKCKAGMILFKSSSPDGSAEQGSCGCKAGKFWDASVGEAKCNSCNQGFYCTGGAILKAVPQACPTGMTTLNKGASNKWQCVELPGYGYSIKREDWLPPEPQAVLCTGNTYSTGYAKKGCVACPAGYKVPTDADRTQPGACRVPAGYFLRLPGEVAACPQGEYRAQYDPPAKCLPCPEGSTTEPAKERMNEGREWCTTLKPGYFPSEVYQSDLPEGITGHTHYVQRAQACPQRHWCPGGKPTQGYTDFELQSSLPPDQHTTLLFRCAQGYGAAAGSHEWPLWTKSIGTESKDQCLVPPGYEVTGEDNSVRPCASPQFRKGWSRPASNVKCQQCATGPGVTSEPSETLTKYNMMNQMVSEEAVPVYASAGSCALLPGYGMYVEGSGFVTEACTDNFYGAPEKIYGQGVHPCKPCPTNMVTPSEKWSYGLDFITESGLWINPLACQTQPGYGYDGQVSMKCPKGTYNQGSNREECKPCPWGYTTRDDEAAQDVSACVLAPGFQKTGPDAPVEECPVGTYADEPAYYPERSCRSCDYNQATMDTGSDSASDCVGCLPGYGTVESAYPVEIPICYECGSYMFSFPGYGPTTRTGTECVACPQQNVYTVFTNSQGETISYTSPAVIKPAQTNSAGCVAKFAMIEPASLVHKRPDYGGTMQKIGWQPSVSVCADYCANNMGYGCMFFTFQFSGDRDDGSGECFLAQHYYPWYSHGYLAFKAVSSGDRATFASKENATDASTSNTTASKAMGSGLYTYYRVDESFITILEEDANPQSYAINSRKECIKACNRDSTCAAAWLRCDVWVDQAVPDANSDFITECRLYNALGAPRYPVGDELLLTVSFVKATVEFLG